MLSITALQGLPEVQAGTDLVALIAESTQGAPAPPAGAVLVVAQKVVSKAEDRLVSLNRVQAGPVARDVAADVHKDPRLVELILSESRGIIRKSPGVLIVEHRTGHVLANAGIDSSNIAQDPQDPKVLLWPEDPDASAQRLSEGLEPLLGFMPPVIINDSIGRPWRYGTVAHAIGCSGIAPLWNQVGGADRFGNKLRVTEPATADAIAAAAALIQGEAAEGLPVVWVAGCPYQRDTSADSKSLLRDQSRDLFR